MKPESFVRILAGSVILISVALTYFFSQWWLLLTAFVGVNLIQSAITGFCPPTVIAKKLGYFKDCECSCRKDRK
jgi:hypothetical protein